MNNFMSVTVFHSTDNLLEKLSCVSFFQLTLVDDVVEEFRARVFQDHDDIGRCGDDRESIEAFLSLCVYLRGDNKHSQLDDVRVS